MFNAFNDGSFNGTTCIAAKAIVEMGKEIFLKEAIRGKVGQCKYIAIVDSEGPGKNKKDSEHKEINLTIDMPEDLIVYQNKDWLTLELIKLISCISSFFSLTSGVLLNKSTYII